MKRDAIRGATWLVPARAVKALAHFAGIFVLARHFLDPNDFGIAMLLLAITGFVSAGADWGMGVLIVQRKGIDDRRASRIALTAGVLSALAMAFGGIVLDFKLLIAAAPLLVFAGAATPARARLERELRFRNLAIVDAGTAVVGAGARVAFAAHGWGPLAIIFGDVVAGALGALALCFAAPARRNGNDTRLAADGARIVGTRATDSVCAYADRYGIGFSLGTVVLGAYAFAWQHAMLLVSQLTPVAEQIALPLFARVQNDKPALARAYLTLTRTFALVVIPFAGLLYLAAPWLVEWLYPQRWHDAIGVMRALCVTAAATGLNSHPGLVWLALGDTRLRLRWSLCNVVAIVAVVLLGLPHGAVGVAYALAARSLVATVAAQVITKRKAGVGHRDYALAVAPGLAFGLAFYFLAFFAFFA